MLQFDKGAEPPSLRAARSVPGAVWEQPPAVLDKQEVRAALLRDQQGLCAYCQRRIANEPATDAGRGAEDRRMRVEHWQARHPKAASTGPAQRSASSTEFVWDNLFGVCSGRVPLEPGSDRLGAICDAARGNRPLFLNPLGPSGRRPRDHLRYLGDGKLTSSQPQALEDVEAHLNLNASFLKGQRVEVIEGLMTQVGGRFRFSEAGLRRLLAASARSEFPEVVRYYIERWLDKLAR